MSGWPGLRALVVDDDSTIRELVEYALSDEGFDVRGAADGDEALRLLQTWRADVVILDLMMPVMDGWEFRRRQLEDPSLASIHVMVMSANRCLPSAEAVLSPCAMLAKPFNLDELIQQATQCASEGAAVGAKGHPQAV